jgi:hypothetical protein
VEAVPDEQSSDGGGSLRKLSPFAEPQVPFTLSLAEQLASVPPFSPSQVQSHGPVPEIEEAVPDSQRFDVGLEGKLFPFDEPQEAFTSRLAEQ